MRAIESGASFSHAHDEWETPQWLYETLDKEFGFTLDVAASTQNHKHAIYLSSNEDGLSQEWFGCAWMNPPYSQISQWVRKAHEQAQRGTTVVCLVPSRTDTRWWHEFVVRSHEVRFIKGRLKFGGAKYNAPFPSAIVIFHAQTQG